MLVHKRERFKSIRLLKGNMVSMGRLILDIKQDLKDEEEDILGDYDLQQYEEEDD